jgi:hypothetical protein
MPPHRIGCRVERPDQWGAAADAIQQAYVAGGRNPVSQDCSGDSPDRPAQRLATLQIFESCSHWRETERAQRQPSSEFRWTGEPFKPGSISHVAGLREVQAQAANEAEILSDRHPPAPWLSFSSAASWVILMMLRKAVESKLEVTCHRVISFSSVGEPRFPSS